ncbi:unnamed protein product [Notodromas monacha]|uniref:Uncharacterized protein n=1 Tax=Notodromas monacha TaxID=399045 RepID=A0A7R9BRI4_9CRUS|nr:unnamed protein product [Notodromas monacha]CAG0920373.1 unnamed protein product [Notodromas monacha]
MATLTAEYVDPRDQGHDLASTNVTDTPSDNSSSEDENRGLDEEEEEEQDDDEEEEDVEGYNDAVLSSRNKLAVPCFAEAVVCPQLTTVNQNSCCTKKVFIIMGSSPCAGPKMFHSPPDFAVFFVLFHTFAEPGQFSPIFPLARKVRFEITSVTDTPSDNSSSEDENRGLDEEEEEEQDDDDEEEEEDVEGYNDAVLSSRNKLAVPCFAEAVVCPQLTTVNQPVNDVEMWKSRFRVVKLASAVSYRRDRWNVCDFHDGDIRTPTISKSLSVPSLVNAIPSHPLHKVVTERRISPLAIWRIFNSAPDTKFLAVQAKLPLQATLSDPGNGKKAESRVLPEGVALETLAKKMLGVCNEADVEKLGKDEVAVGVAKCVVKHSRRNSDGFRRKRTLTVADVHRRALVCRHRCRRHRSGDNDLSAKQGNAGPRSSSSEEMQREIHETSERRLSDFCKDAKIRALSKRNCHLAAHVQLLKDQVHSLKRSVAALQRDKDLLQKQLGTG